MSTPTAPPARAEPPGRIILITGNMAAGKSTVAQALAQAMPRSVHLRGDLFRRMIVRGQAEMGFELSEEAQRQLDLRYELAALVAARYAQAGFTVVYQDILIGEGLTRAVERLMPMQPLVVVLCPHPDVIARREAARAKTGYRDRAMIDDFDRVLRHATPRIGLWLDTSAMTVDETVAAILQHLESQT